MAVAFVLVALVPSSPTGRVSDVVVVVDMMMVAVDNGVVVVVVVAYHMHPVVVDTELVASIVVVVPAMVVHRGMMEMDLKQVLLHSNTVVTMVVDMDAGAFVVVKEFHMDLNLVHHGKVVVEMALGVACDVVG